MKKLLNISLSFLMIFTVAFATIETVDSEPAFAVTAYTKLGNTKVSKFKDIKASAMDDQGHMFAIAKNNSNNLIPYYLASNSTKGVKVGKSVSIDGIYDAGTYFEYNGKKYVMAQAPL